MSMWSIADRTLWNRRLFIFNQYEEIVPMLVHVFTRDQKFSRMVSIHRNTNTPLNANGRPPQPAKTARLEGIEKYFLGNF